MKRYLIVAMLAVGLLNLTGCADGPLRRFLRGAPCGAGAITPGPILGGNAGCTSGCASDVTCGVDAVYGGEVSCGTGFDTSYYPSGVDQYNADCPNCGGTTSMPNDYYLGAPANSPLAPIGGLPSPAADLTN